MLPVALAFLGWWKARRIAWRDLFPLTPFFALSAAAAAFGRLDAGVLTVARSLGASPLFLLVRVAVPMALPELLAGAALAWAQIAEAVDEAGFEAISD